MVALAHIEKFIEDHPEYFSPEKATSVLATARATKQDPLPSEIVEDAMGKEAAEILFKLMSSDAAYLKISLEASQGVLNK